jgi:hypothetical protein
MPSTILGSVKNIQCRLDRAIASDGFINMFSPIKVKYLQHFGSEHSAIKISLEEFDNDNHKKKVHLFRLEECWSKEANCEQLVRDIWRRIRGNSGGKLVVIQSLDEEFKQLRTNEVKKDILKIEAFLNNDTVWDGSVEDIQRYNGCLIFCL